LILGVPGSLVGVAQRVHADQMGKLLSGNHFPKRPRLTLFARGSWAETSWISAVLREETVGGALLLIAAAVALIWANSPWQSSYHALSAYQVGTDRVGLHLDLSLANWAAEGLLAVFFFVVGLELKREFVAGDLRDPVRASLPIAAAVGGMVVPALIFVAIAAHAPDGAYRGWAIPTATDIAFAVAVLAVISTHLPSALRTFLLTLAVVDDLLAITVIAVFYTEHINLAALGLSLIPLLLFGICVQRRAAWWLLIPLAVTTWVLVHESGVHATVAGVVLGFTVPVSDSERFDRRVHPLSAGVAVPVFAFFAAGVTTGGYSGLTTALTDPITLGVVAGLVIGKTVGVFGTARILSAVTRASLDSALRWIDVFGLSLLAGVGFTVSLLIGDLAYGEGSARADSVKVGVLAGSVLAAILAAVVLRLRNRHYRAAPNGQL
jgi:Na+:H+ antiporter, NhaA family